MGLGASDCPGPACGSTGSIKMPWASGLAQAFQPVTSQARLPPLGIRETEYPVWKSSSTRLVIRITCQRSWWTDWAIKCDTEGRFQLPSNPQAAGWVEGKKGGLKQRVQLVTDTTTLAGWTEAPSQALIYLDDQSLLPQTADWGLLEMHPPPRSCGSQPATAPTLTADPCPVLLRTPRPGGVLAKRNFQANNTALTQEAIIFLDISPQTSLFLACSHQFCF